MVGLVSGVQHDPAAAAGAGRPADGEGHQTGLTPLMSSSLHFFYMFLSMFMLNSCVPVIGNPTLGFKIK